MITPDPPYWATEDSIAAWRDHRDHIDAKSRGRSDWYDRYELRVALVERAVTFHPGPGP